jgi:hypothetical protein
MLLNANMWLDSLAWNPLHRNKNTGLVFNLNIKCSSLLNLCCWTQKANNFPVLSTTDDAAILKCSISNAWNFELTATNQRMFCADKIDDFTQVTLIISFYIALIFHMKRFYVFYILYNSFMKLLLTDAISLRWNKSMAPSNPDTGLNRGCYGN